ncbi:MAG: excinuclease ABC subunit UvrC [Bacteroidales bacterium]
MPTEISDTLKETLKLLPEKPGVYQYFDVQNERIYVGKAKNLKRRVNSYFNKEQSGKVLALVRKIHHLEYIVVNTETDALLLENNLIKEYRPHYNILLKDDKTYPWLCITKENFPRIFSTRRYIPNGSLYFGPYPCVRTMNILLDLIHDLYPLRNCPYTLSQEIVAKKKIKLCLQYQMKRCLGPCQGLQTEENYSTQIAQITAIIKGHIQAVLQDLNKKMLFYAENLEFRKAQAIKEKIELLQVYQSKSTVVSDKLTDLDVFSVLDQENNIYFNYMRVLDGRVVQAHTIDVKKKLEETPQELLSTAITEFRHRFQSDAPEIILPFLPDFQFPNLKYTIPVLGDKKKLLDLSQKNISYFLLEKSKRLDLTDPDRHSKQMLLNLQKVLGLKKLPVHIECFDNSNMQGDYPVAAMSVSKDGKLSKRDYRHFLIRTVTGPNDYASMEEVITRRYQRLQNENQPLPQLVIVDGGKGQLSCAYKSLKALHLENDIFLLGIAENLEELYRIGDPYPLSLDKKSDVLKHIQLLRDEVHRFGITHYRKRHLKGVIKTELTEIKGIGKKTALELLQHFHSVKQLRSASLLDIESVIGPAKALLVYQYFQQKQDKKESIP